MLDVIYTQYMKKFQSQDGSSWLHPTSEINTRNQGHLELTRGPHNLINTSLTTELLLLVLCRAVFSIGCLDGHAAWSWTGKCQTSTTLGPSTRLWKGRCLP